MAEQFTLVDHWIPIRGLWNREPDNSMIYEGTGADAEPSADLPDVHGIALSGVRFNNGRVRTTINLSSDAGAGRILVGFSGRNAGYFAAGIGGGQEAYVVEEFDPRTRWTRLSDAGRMTNLELNHPHQVEVELKGQRLKLIVGSIKVLDHVLSRPVEPEQVAIYASGVNSVRFGPVEVATRARTAFVVMQFTSPFDELFEDVIQPVCAESGIQAYRASDIYRPGIVLQSIIQGLAESSVIIAEITPVNPNVFYELGYAHGLRKPVILLAERDTALPFDIGGYRVIFYENAIRGKSSLEADLRLHLANIFG